MKTVIIGGGAAGASCAARLRRLDENAQIVILEKSDVISVASCGLPYYFSDIIGDREEMLVSTPAYFKKILNVDVKTGVQVVHIDRMAKTVVDESGEKYTYDKLVIATGAKNIIPPIKGHDGDHVFSFRTLAEVDRIRQYVSAQKPSSAVVVGGGFIGLEVAENLIKMGIKTALVEKEAQVLSVVDPDMAAFAEEALAKGGVSLFLGHTVQEIGEKEVVLSDGRQVDAALVILSAGIRADAGIAKKSGLKTRACGAVKVNAHMMTSDPDIYAAGDCVEIKEFVSGEEDVIALAGPANRQGRIIADHICGIDSTYKNTMATSIIKVFDTVTGHVGLSEKQLRRKNIPYLKIHAWGYDHASYYPGAKAIFSKLLFEKSGKILGAQIVGENGVDKRIDVIATMMRMGGTAHDMVDAELAYAPPFSSAKDPVNVLGMVAGNVLSGRLKMIFPDELGKDCFLIDMRPERSYAEGTIKEAVNIPLAQLRGRLGDIPKDKKIVLFCNRGFQSYMGYRILVQKGFECVYSLSGGISFYQKISAG
ncbi:MAG: FAD-dependent oxidoreductase [Lactobacillales bacterium]|jgi:NADPH-dependent 2,4-dienoyl-CoA reductase/sulfur reductase-like enzyme/rhodanese-related sulfurtransferase|nr:FAD-dependent oxidoreductase [Lactobacillales bacterium]